MNGRLRLNALVDRAASESSFSPTVFRIYDRSSADICDRLICIMPFDWWVWACRGELYILNPEGGIKCATGNTPAVRVFSDQFVEVCLSLEYDSLLSGYTTLPCKIVPYKITTSVFTILSALNILVKRWVTFVDRESDEANKPRFMDAHRANRKRRDATDTTPHVIQSSTVLRSFVRHVPVASSKRSHTRMLEVNRDRAKIKNARRGASSYSIVASDTNDGAIITEYQHTEEHDLRRPTYTRSPIE